MEASVAAAGESQGQEATTTQTPGGFDLSPVLDRLGEIGGRLDQFEARFAQEPEGEQQQDDGLDLPDLYAENGEMDERAAQQWLDKMVEQRTSSAIEKALNPLVERIENMQIDRDAQTLVGQYPELADPQVAEAVVKQARNMAAEMGLDPKMGTRPGFIELVYKAQRADQMAAGEVPVGDLRQHQLEAGAGGSPGGGSGPSIAEQIVKSRSGNSFWGT